MSEGFDRDAARARCEAATPGPWFVEAHGVMDETRFRTIVMTGDSEQDDHDAAFIACARTDLPEALDALDAAEAERDEALQLLERIANPVVEVRVGSGSQSVVDDEGRIQARVFLADRASRLSQKGTQ